MKQFQLLVLPIIASFAGLAQSPVQWSFSAEKVKSNQFRVHLTAKIQPGFHVFSITQPEDAIALPTRISFNSSAEIDETSPIREDGTLEKLRDATLDVESWQFSEKVDFSSVVTLKSNKSKTILTGQVEFQACSSDKCYPPARISFSVPLNH